MKSFLQAIAKLSLTAKLSLASSLLLVVAIGITIYSAQTKHEVRSHADQNSEDTNNGEQGTNDAMDAADAAAAAAAAADAANSSASNGGGEENIPGGGYCAGSCQVNAPPAPISGMTVTCNPNTSCYIDWGPSDGATHYQGRFDDQKNAWNGNCDNPNPGDGCWDNGQTYFDGRQFTPGDTYDLWIHACNQRGCSAPLDVSFITPNITPGGAAPPPVSGLAVTCNPNISCHIAWNPSDGATHYQERFDDKVNPWSGDCNNLNPGDGCWDTNSESFVTQLTPGHDYNVSLHACNKYGCSGPSWIGVKVPLPTPTPTP